MSHWHLFKGGWALRSGGIAQDFVHLSAGDLQRWRVHSLFRLLFVQTEVKQKTFLVDAAWRVQGEAESLVWMSLVKNIPGQSQQTLRLCSQAGAVLCPWSQEEPHSSYPHSEIFSPAWPALQSGPHILLESSGGVGQKQKPHLDGKAGTYTSALTQFNFLVSI